MMKCRESVSVFHSHVVRVVTLFMTFLLLHSSITPSVYSQLESEPKENSQNGIFHFECTQFSSEPPTALRNDESENESGGGEERYGGGHSIDETQTPVANQSNHGKQILEYKMNATRERKETKRVINAALPEIDMISRGNGESLCATPSKMFRIFTGVKIQTDFFHIPNEKADLVAYFLQLSRERGRPGVAFQLDEHELSGTFNSIDKDTQLENLKLVQIIPSQNPPYSLYVDKKNGFKTIKITGAELNGFPWYFDPNESPIPKNESRFNVKSKILIEGVKGFWTWPYFRCKETVDENRKGDWVISYSVPFLLSSKGGPSNRPVYGLLSFDIDLSMFNINQCDFHDKAEENADKNSNPLHAFRGTHKCDRLTTTCEWIKDQRWRKGSYTCKCKKAHHALYKQWNNSIGGLEAESTWCTAWRGNESEEVTFLDVVSCKSCHPGCPDCNDKHSCLADMNSTLRLVLLCISVLCTLAAVGFIVVVCKFRRIPVFKTSSPIFICIMLSGCIIMYSEMIALYPELTVASCIAVKWTRHLGFCITYTALALKLCRVYLTFRVKSAHKIKLTEKHLLHWMSPIMVIMLLYLFAWTISDPPDLEPMYTVDEKRFSQCVYNWWDHALAIGEVIFLGYGVWICWKIRENPDAQFISYSIYNIALVNVAMVSLHLLFLPKAGPTTKYVLAFVRTQLSTSTTIGLVIGSKLIRVWRGETTSLKEIALANSANGFGQETLDLGEENLQLKDELMKMATQIEKLKFYAMCKNNPHLKQSSVNINTAEMDFGRLDSFSAL